MQVAAIRAKVNTMYASLKRELATLPVTLARRAATKNAWSRVSADVEHVPSSESDEPMEE